MNESPTRQPSPKKSINIFASKQRTPRGMKKLRNENPQASQNPNRAKLEEMYEVQSSAAWPSHRE